MRTTIGLALTVALYGTPATAQFPPERATNLQILPSGIAMDSLIEVMSGFTRALGVRCAHCHVQRQGQTFEQIDFALDENPKKNIARAIWRLVTAINNEHLSRLAVRHEPEIRVTCATCHRGLIEPRPVRVNPRSTFALRQLAQAHLSVHDTASAIAAYERALVINPSDKQSQRARDALRRRDQLHRN